MNDALDPRLFQIPNFSKKVGDLSAMGSPTSLAKAWALGDRSSWQQVAIALSHQQSDRPSVTSDLVLNK